MALNLNYKFNSSVNWTQQYLIEVLSGGKKPILTDPQIINAFLKIDRKDFLPFSLHHLAYNDMDLDLGNGVKLEKPTTVAKCLSYLKPLFGDTYLVVGTGCAYSTAIVAYIAGEQGKVYSLEKNPSNINQAKMNLQKYTKLRNIEVKLRNYSNGFLEKAPFDRIFIDEIDINLAESLKMQLRTNGGILVSQTQNYDFKVIERKTNSEFEEEKKDYISAF